MGKMHHQKRVENSRNLQELRKSAHCWQQQRHQILLRQLVNIYNVCNCFKNEHTCFWLSLRNTSHWRAKCCTSAKSWFVSKEWRTTKGGSSTKSWLTLTKRSKSSRCRTTENRRRRSSSSRLSKRRCRRSCSKSALSF